MKKTVILGITIALFAAGLFWLTFERLAIENHEVATPGEILEILESRQRYDGSHIDDLVAMGPKASGHIREALFMEPRWPYVLVRALCTLGDQDSINALVDYVRIESRRPEGENESHANSRAVVVGEAARCLTGLPPSSWSVPTELVTLASDNRVAPGVRVYLSAIGCRYGNETQSKEAEERLLKFYSERSEYPRNSLTGFAPSSVLYSLAACGTDKANLIALEKLEFQSHPYEVIEIIKGFEVSNAEGAYEAIERLVTQEGQILDIRIESGLYLLRSKRKLQADVRAVLSETVAEARQYENYPPTVDLISAALVAM
ncbi:MAG: hypothetical protein AAF578_13995 [Pseudomonadota bacterium]